MLKRGKNKVSTDYYFKDIYKEFKNTSELVSIYDITEKKWSQINEEINDYLINELYNGRYIRLPLLGIVKIIKSKSRLKIDEDGNMDFTKIPINYQETWKLWFKKYPGKTAEEIRQIPNKPLVYLENEHTSGYIHKFKWSRTKCRIRHKSSYAFKTVRKYNRKLTQLLKDPNFKGDFYES